MAKKLIHTDDSDLGRLHCDNDRCNHTLDQALPWGPWLIGFPCPKCGSDMLTRKDFFRVEKFKRGIVWINKWFGWLGTETVDHRHESIAIQIGDGKP